MMKRIVVSIYIDPDYYPPTINAILNLASTCEELVVITRNNSRDDYPFPANVKLVKCGDYASVRDTEKKGFLYKVTSFLRFTYMFWKYAASSKTQLILLCDPLPLFSFYLVKDIIGRKNKIVWYHNHDMPTKARMRKYSIGWMAASKEHAAMDAVQYFSLPSNDRLVYYPNWKRASNYFYIPNYPSLKVYQKPPAKNVIGDEIRMIFQGSIGGGHAFEEVLELLQEKICGKPVRLLLKGSVRPQYKEKLDELAATFKVTRQFTWIGLGAYSELPAITASCHIGNAIQIGSDEVRKTLGTASNKIYEYAASGVPVILYDNEQFKKYLDKYDWAFFSDGSVASLRSTIEAILQNHEALSISARNAFENGLNFETYFVPVMDRIIKSLPQK